MIELGGEVVPFMLYPPVAFGEVFVASMPDLWRMKGWAFAITRPGEKARDQLDADWLVERMVALGVEYDAIEFLEMLLAESCAKTRVLDRIRPST
jgi:hypothetical protein